MSTKTDRSAENACVKGMWQVGFTRGFSTRTKFHFETLRQSSQFSASVVRFAKA